MDTTTIFRRERPASGVELDERQRRALHTASHRTLRVTMIALLVGMISLGFAPDGLEASMVLAGIVFVTMVAHWWNLRRAGVERELEDIKLIETARDGVLSRQTVRMFLFFGALGVADNISHSRTAASDFVVPTVGAAVGALLLGYIESRYARRRRAEIESGGESRDFDRGRRLGQRLAILFRKT